VNAVLHLLAEEPLLLLFLLFAVGTAAGGVRIAGVHIGPAAVLFTAIALTAYGASVDVELAVPEAVGTLGLVLFTYTVGVMSGPSFFHALRSGARVMGSVVGLLCLAAAIAVGVGRLLGLSGPTIAGTFAGALTNTPALAAASERAGDAAPATIGYSMAYVFGVVGMLAAAAYALRRRDDVDAPRPLTNLTVRVERSDLPRVRDIEAAYAGEVAFSRVRHGEATPILVASDDDTLRRDDLVTVVGPSDLVEKVALDLGHRSSHTLVADRKALDFRRVTLSRPSLAGRTIAELDLYERFGATVSRVRRGDVDMVAADDLVVLPGDRLRVIAPAARMADVSAYLGDSLRGLSDINPLGLAVGVTLGLLAGEVHIPLPGGGFSLGAAAGTLVVGLVLGRLGRIGPLVTTVPHGAASSLSQFGMLAFLTYAGTKAGALFVPALSSGEAWRVALLGVVITSALAVTLLVTMRVALHVGGTRLSGIVAGAQTQPAVLAFANERTGFDARVAVGYALVYPAAMIVKVLLAQVLAGV
jgi:putative transport protein